MSKRHIAKSGILRGRWVTCNAKKTCRNGGMHIDDSTLEATRNWKSGDGKQLSLHSITEVDVRNFNRSGPSQQVLALQAKIGALFDDAPSNAFTPKTPSAESLVSNAVSVSLDYQGEKPKWWNSYVAEAENHEDYPTTPQLLDVIDSPSGPLAVVWQAQSHQPNDTPVTSSSGAGVNITYYKSIETGEILGHVKASWSDEKTYAHSFGDDEFTPFRWRRRFGGSYYPFDGGGTESFGERNLEGEELLQKRRDVWVTAHRDFKIGATDANGKTVDYVNVNESHLPDDAQVAKDVSKWGKKFRKDMNADIDYYRTPFIDYSSVDASLVGKGYGSALYVYAARQLGKEGKVLRGSGTQTDYAKGAWKGFKKNIPNRVTQVTTTYRGNDEDHLALDFTK